MIPTTRAAAATMNVIMLRSIFQGFKNLMVDIDKLAIHYRLCQVGEDTKQVY
jgi:hypothetical protein